MIRRCAVCRLELMPGERDVCPGCGAGVPRPLGRPYELRDVNLDPEAPLVIPPRSPADREPGDPRPVVISRKQARREALAGRLVPGMRKALLEAQLARPKRRSDCEGQPRPCPWVSCKWHLYVDVTEAGGIRLNHPGKELEELEECCALDVAEAGGATLERVGELLGLTRERIRQLEEVGFARYREADFVDEIGGTLKE